jgi:hypothetical protein
MNQTLSRQLLQSRYRSFVAILHDRGISLDLPSDEDVAKMNDADLSETVRQLRDVARTPVQG